MHRCSPKTWSSWHSKLPDDCFLPSAGHITNQGQTLCVRAYMCVYTYACVCMCVHMHANTEAWGTGCDFQFCAITLAWWPHNHVISLFRPKRAMYAYMHRTCTMPTLWMCHKMLNQWTTNPNTVRHFTAWFLAFRSLRGHCSQIFSLHDHALLLSSKPCMLSMWLIYERRA